MSQHAMPQPASTAPEPTHAERARTLLETESLGTLATHSAKHPGFPFASVMPFALGGNGTPLFLISGMAMHTQNLLADPRVSLLVTQSGGDGDPLGSPRATLLGTAHRLDSPDPATRAAYLARHPSAQHWISYDDFSFFQLVVEQVYFIGGFGVMGWVTAGDYASASPDPIAEAAAGIIEHMNRDHAGALRDIVKMYGGLEAEEAAMVSCDRLGFVVRVRTAEGMKGRRIAFPHPVESRDAARAAFVTMAKQSRS